MAWRPPGPEDTQKGGTAAPDSIDCPDPGTTSPRAGNPPCAVRRRLAGPKATLDVEKRRELMCELQTILKEDGGIALPRFNAVMYAHTKRVQDFAAAPHDHMLLAEVWLDDEA